MAYRAALARSSGGARFTGGRGLASAREVRSPDWSARIGGPLLAGARDEHTVTPDDEARWLEQAQRGDAGAYGRLVRAHQRRVHATAMQLLGDRGEAEDATQETFLRAWRALDRFDGRAKLSTWLYRICVNVSLNIIRRRRRAPTADVDDPRIPEPAADPTQGRSDPVAALERDEIERRLGKALDQLSPTLRSAVVLVLLQGLPHKEAAEVLGCPEGTVAWRIHEARRRLRDSLRDLADEVPHASAAGAGRASS
ncbi:MAG: sigma-70 family RNA polymerase sigma factor [Myxococcales bacterium]|nr:sigma-70 family RNA polymerase sigma factor [Myxococcales bacterium]